MKASTTKADATQAAPEAVASQPAAAPQAAPKPQVPPSLPGFDPAAFTADQRGQLENLSMNLAKAAITAQGAIAEMALRQAERPAALSPDPFHVAPALTQVMGRLAAQPDRMMRAQADLFSRYLDLWQSAARRASGETAEPVVS
ncbi:MAG: class I poly(R)-hydroxyalkanoic acid synthase, partial [Pseudomonadota bacterium]